MINLGLKNFSFSEKVIYWTAILTPIWWLLGIQPLFYPAVAVFLLAINLRLDKLIRHPLPAFIWAWFILTIVSLATAIAGLDEINASFKTIAAALVTFFKSYLMIFAYLVVPFLAQIRVQVVTQAVAWMSVGTLINLVIQLGLLAIGIQDAVFIPVLARLIPGDASTSLLVKSAKIAEFFGIPLPRSLLHTADPPILGAFAVLCILICLTEKDLFLRRLSLAGGIAALIISFSRSAWIGLLAALSIILFFRSHQFKQIYLWITATVFWTSSLAELTIQQLFAKPVEIFTSARENSSETREIVVQKTLEAWQEKFWFGWGIIRGDVWLYENVYLKLGSFSTYAAVLYLNGIIGFIALLLSLALTLIAFYRPATAGNLSCQISFSALVVLYALIQATPLSWMAIYLWFFFVWLGAVAAENRQHDTSNMFTWEHMLQLENNR